MTPIETTRRTLLQSSAVIASLAATGAALGGEAAPRPAAGLVPLKAPASGVIPTAFVISDGAVLIDFAGPWEVFGHANMVRPDGSIDFSPQTGFDTYTVAASAKPILTSSGMKITPDHTFADAPLPKVIVIPAQRGADDAALDWIRRASKTADVTMSVCTGAFVLAETGLLSGKSATTHHAACAALANKYPDIHVKRGYRFVDDGNIASSGGLTCGVDLAFHIVERYRGRQAALLNAINMEYQGKGWMDASGAGNA
jgi:transcriptional regulator GlxA family with amidase domain